MSGWTTSDWIGFWGAMANLLTAVVTGVGLGLAIHQLKLAAKHARTAFEDELGSEYRALARDLPVDALLGRSIAEITTGVEARPGELEDIRSTFFHYFDLCNYQAYLRHRNRVSRDTWNEWASGMRANFAKPAFVEAWAQVDTALPKSFDELRRTMREGFKTDPRDWK